ncbi:NHS-like protein 1 isoform X2 [Astyanax mexicanus]|uniref:NHS-like protein 1 isoform X2 n=1 Tax=Astyanax mexicanus TaxID=7994 RepID=UPI0020CB69F7|nr:NHS-like protein 1 isoform X2 [Astyanax mexicanus]
MPFHQRSVEPRRVSRLKAVEGGRGCGAEDGLAPPEGRRFRRAVLFSSLEEVSCHTLGSVLRQLSDLSRHASEVFFSIEEEAGVLSERSSRIQSRLERIQSIAQQLDHRKIKIPVSNLDEESKWTVHYTAPWHQQENVFLPASRPACVEELHRQAKVNLKTALRECDKLRKDGFRSSQYYSQGPMFSGSAHSQDEEDTEGDEADNKSTASSAEEDKSSNPMRAQTPVQGEGSEVDGQESSFKTAPLPTPEEKMRQQAQAILTDIVPINVTGETFDRQASVRRSLINTDTLVRRPKKVKRRKTISGLPDNLQQELATKGRGGELRPQSMFIPGQYPTLGRSGSVSSTLRRSETRDSGCQTEEVKIVPPSMRRIRAQRGQGIAAQMAGISTSATNISTVSDGSSSGSPTHVMAPRFNGDVQRFHSLPRGARVSLNAEPLYSSTPCRPEDNTATTPRQIGKLQADETVVHMRNAPRTNTPTRPKSQEVRSSQGEWGSVTGPACVVSPHAAYSTSLIPNATLSCSAEVIALHSTSNAGQQQLHARPLSMASTLNGESSTSVATGTDTADGDMQETRQSDSSLHSRSTLAAETASSDEQWIYDTPENVLPRRTLTSSCSTPINHLYNSLEHSPKGTDSSSLYSMDNDGYYTSMHLDSGLRSKSHGIAARATRHSMYECIGQPGDRSSMYSDQSLSRSISLRKCKKPPLPPARTDSLRRKPKNLNGAHGAAQASNGSILNESLIATLQQSLQNGLKSKGSSTSPSHSPCSDYEDPWMLRPRSQSSVSAGSSGMSAVGVANVYSICHVTPSHSDTSSLRSDYAESWGYYMDYPRPHCDQTQSPPHAHSVSSGGQTGGMADGQSLHNGPQTTLPPAQGDMSVKPQPNTSSPDRVHRLTSPSSGYSSQSNTPTAGTPVPSFMRSMSPSGCKPKPRVPERKSSLLSSVSISSSSTSLSSNTSDSVKNNIPAPPPPPPLPLSSASLSPLSPPSFPPPLPPSSPVYTTSFPPPPAPAFPSTPQQEAAMSPTSLNSSPEFPPPPPPEVLNDHSMSPNTSFSPSHHTPPPPPPPPPLLFPPAVSAHTPSTSSSTPNLKPAIPSSASLKGIKDGLKPVNSERRPTAATQSEESGRSAMPLITPFALQSVQLRSVKRTENGEAEANSKSQETVIDQVASKIGTPVKFKKQEHPTVLPLESCSAPEFSRVSSPSHPGKKLSVKSLISREESDSNLAETKFMEEIPSEHIHLPSGFINNAQVSDKAEVDGTYAESQQTTPKKKPPVVSKKPKFSPVVSPSEPEPAADEKQTLTNGGDTIDLPTLQKQVSVCDDSTEGQEPPSAEEQERENDKSNTESSVSPTEMSEFESSTLSTAGLAEKTSQTAVIDETAVDEAKGVSDGEVEEDGGVDEDGVSSTTESVSSKDDENGEVFESSPSPSINGEVFEDMVTPTRPRTTEDLFAAIHRSKRKVLGRKESEDERSRGSPSSPPVTPTGACPSLGSSLPRQMGSIQRNLRKSATSSDTFKALLLKKGSRSETSFRMSAAEMLRSTDPRFQRTRSLDSSLDPTLLGSPDSPCASPSRSKRAPEDWARSEGMIPRYSMGSPSSPSPSSMVGPKYGRSRTPPSAASSKYNARSRILSSPMTVICEREGELAESGEGWDDCPDSPATPVHQTVPQDSNGTLCEEERS